MKSEEWNRELLKRVQQKAEELRETREGDDKLQSELEAVQEVYGLSAQSHKFGNVFLCSQILLIRDFR